MAQQLHQADVPSARRLCRAFEETNVLMTVGYCHGGLVVEWEDEPSGNYVTYRSGGELTVAEVFREQWEAYRRDHEVTAEEARVAGALMACRTAALGGTD